MLGLAVPAGGLLSAAGALLIRSCAAGHLAPPSGRNSLNSILAHSRSLHGQPTAAPAAGKQARPLEEATADASKYSIKEDPHLGQLLRTRWPYLALLGAGASTLLFYSVFHEPKVTHRCFLDLEVDGRPAGRITLGLYGDDVPKTVENFVSLATHDCGFGFHGSPIHRVVHSYQVWGGDVTQGDGTGGVSAFGPHMGVESMAVRHRRGAVSMALDEQNRVRSQWFITLVTAPVLDRKAVAFGQVVEGLEVVEAISRLPVDEQQRPLAQVKVAASGMLPA